jgi:predicted enzyme related to lactoylglutathione lyase
MASKKSVRKPAKKVTKARSTARRPKRVAKSAPSAMARKIQPGVITHTELASANPPATQAWCAKVLGWKFAEPMPTPTGPYHMWRFDNGTGGGIRSNNPPEIPGSIPYCEVASIKATYAKALGAGATAMVAPQQIPGGMGWIAMVAAPGGVAIGFWAKK